MSNRWIFKCKNCGADITFQIVDVNSLQAAQPAKPLIVEQTLKCSLCKTLADYTGQDLQFR